MRIPCLPLLFMALVPFAATPARGQSYKLTGPLVPLRTSDVSDFAITRDGSQAVYTSTERNLTQSELFVAPLDGPGTPQPLSEDLGTWSVIWFSVSPDSQTTVYLAESPRTGCGCGVARALYSRRNDRTAAQVRLTPYGLTPNTSLITPDGSSVVFQTTSSTNSYADLYSVPIDGGSAPRKLTAGGPYQYRKVEVTADGSRLVYRLLDGPWHLYSVPVDGSSGPVELNGALSAGGEVLDFAIAGNTVIYYADETLNGLDLYGVPADGSAAGTPASSQSQNTVILPLAVNANGSRVVYRATDGSVTRLKSIAVGAGGPAKVLSGSLFPGQNVTDFEITPDGKHVVYKADQDVNGVFELYSVPVGGSTAAIKLNDPMPVGGDVAAPGLPVELGGFYISPDSSRVLYIGDQVTNNVFELFSVPLDRSAAPVRISGPMVSGGNVVGTPGVAPTFTFDGDSVLYLSDEEQDGVVQIHAAPVDGSSPAVRVDVGPVSTRQIMLLATSPVANLCVYLADELRNEEFQLFAVEPDEAQPSALLSGTIKAIQQGTTVSFVASPTGEHVVYYAEQRAPSLFELFSRDVDAANPPILISGPLLPNTSIMDVVVGPKGRTVTYRADANVAGRPELFAVPIDGTSPPLVISEPLGASAGGGALRNLFVTPDGERSIYLGVDPVTQVWNLYSAPSDGSAPPTNLSDASTSSFTYEFDVRPFAGDRLVYRRWNVTTEGQLFSVPFDGSEAPIEITGSLVPGTDVRAHAVSSDGNTVAYVADAVTLNQFELFVVAADGSTAPLRISSLSIPDGDVNSNFALSPDGVWAVYRADAFSNGVIEIFAVPLDGASTPVRLNGPLVSGGDVVGNFVIAPDSNSVVYRADEDVDTVNELYAAPIDGSAPSILLTDMGLSSGSSLGKFTVTPDGQRLVFVADRLTATVRELFSRPLDASEPIVRLSRDRFDPPRGVLDFQISSDSKYVVYLGDEIDEGSRGIFVAPTAGGHARPLGQEVANGRSIDEFTLTPDSRRALYLGDERELDTKEVYASFLDAAPYVPSTRRRR